MASGKIAPFGAVFVVRGVDPWVGLATPNAPMTCLFAMWRLISDRHRVGTERRGSITPSPPGRGNASCRSDDEYYGEGALL